MLVEILIDKNIIRVNSTEFNNNEGKACGIEMSAYAKNILIENNIIIGTRIGIQFFGFKDYGYYYNVSILFNTLWNVDYTPIMFEKPDYMASDCKMKNNFIYFAGAVEL